MERIREESRKPKRRETKNWQSSLNLGLCYGPAAVSWHSGVPEWIAPLGHSWAAADRAPWQRDRAKTRDGESIRLEAPGCRRRHFGSRYTFWSAAPAQAFLLARARSPPRAARASSKGPCKGRGERQRRRGRCRHVSIARSSTVAHEDISRGTFSLNPLLQEFSLWGIFVLPPFVDPRFPFPPARSSRDSSFKARVVSGGFSP